MPKKWLFAAVALAFAFGFVEALSQLAMRFVLPPHLEARRLELLGHPDSQRPSRHSVHPYLLYIPTPGFADEAGLQHNEHGYRGELVPMRRTPGVARVLCMGGSTTYGDSVALPGEAYPAQLERLLNDNPPPGYDSVEVINAGLAWGTSAELLTHYLLKYRYYEPDVVVLNTGGNDAQPPAGEYYVPDYSHFRRNEGSAPLTLRPLGRVLMRSRFASLVAMGLFLPWTPRQHVNTAEEGNLETVLWYPEAHREARAGREIPDRELAFFRNISTLLREIQQDGAVPVLMPFRSNPDLDASRAMRPWYDFDTTQRYIARNERLLRQIARDRDLLWAPFPASIIKTGRFVDQCHLDAAGSREKAVHVAPTVREAFARRGPPVPATRAALLE